MAAGTESGKRAQEFMQKGQLVPNDIVVTVGALAHVCTILYQLCKPFGLLFMVNVVVVTCEAVVNTFNELEADFMITRPAMQLLENTVMLFLFAICMCVTCLSIV